MYLNIMNQYILILFELLYNFRLNKGAIAPILKKSIGITTVVVGSNPLSHVMIH